MDLRFVIVRIALCQLFHGLGVGLHARAVIDLVVVGIHGAERVEVVALALGLGADAFPFAIAAAPSARFFAGGGAWGFHSRLSAMPQ